MPSSCNCHWIKKVETISTTTNQLHFLKVKTGSLDVLHPGRPTPFSRGNGGLGRGQTVTAACIRISPPWAVRAALLTSWHQAGQVSKWTGNNQWYSYRVITMSLQKAWVYRSNLISDGVTNITKITTTARQPPPPPPPPQNLPLDGTCLSCQWLRSGLVKQPALQGEIQTW